MSRRQLGHRVAMDTPASIVMHPAKGLHGQSVHINRHLTPLDELDLAISLGWGDTPQTKLPADWKTRRNLRGKAGW